LPRRKGIEDWSAFELDGSCSPPPESIEFFESLAFSPSYDSASPHPDSRQQIVSLSPSRCVSPVELTEGTKCRMSWIVGRRESLVLYKSLNKDSPRYLFYWTEGVARGSLGGRIFKHLRSLRIDYKETIPQDRESIPVHLKMLNSGLFDPWMRDPEKVFSGSRISDPGSQNHIWERLVTIFWVKSPTILRKLGQIFFFSTSKLK
jgi:hypothetical protein